MNLAEIRERYPQYNHFSDDELARRLHKRHYSHLDFADFSNRIGYQPTEAAPERAPIIRMPIAQTPEAQVLVQEVEPTALSPTIPGDALQERLERPSPPPEQLEEEKRATLMPLGLVPYIGAGLLTGTTVMFLNFLTGMSFMGVSVPYVDLFNVLLPPLLLHSFILGIVAGKIMNGRASAGFKHSIIMVLVALAGIWMMSNMTFDMGFGGG